MTDLRPGHIVDGTILGAPVELRFKITEVRIRDETPKGTTLSASPDTVVSIRANLMYERPVADEAPPRPKVICLCGSTRYFEEFQRTNLALTLGGVIVLSVGCDTKSDETIFTQANWSADKVEETKQRLDELHLRKIDMADEVLVLNKFGYIGQSTAAEVEYALSRNKVVKYLYAVPGSDALKPIPPSWAVHLTEDPPWHLVQENANFTWVYDAAGEKRYSILPLNGGGFRVAEFNGEWSDKVGTWEQACAAVGVWGAMPEEYHGD